MIKIKHIFVYKKDREELSVGKQLFLQNNNQSIQTIQNSLPNCYHVSGHHHAISIMDNMIISNP